MSAPRLPACWILRARLVSLWFKFSHQGFDPGRKRAATDGGCSRGLATKQLQMQLGAHFSF